jgi:beta-arrestin
LKIDLKNKESCIINLKCHCFFKVFGQVTLTFRYGREDEEVMGLRFCNEAVMSLNKLFPGPSATEKLAQEITPLQVR